MNDADRDFHDDFDEWNSQFHRYYPPGSRLNREFRTSRMLVFASRSWIYGIDTLLRRKTGQSRARWQILFTIAFADQPATMTDICHRARVRWPTAMRVVQDMERDELIAREDNPDDGRSKLLRLTDAGNRVIEQLQPTLDEERKGLLADFSDEELAVCEKMLKRIFEAAVTSGR